MSKKPHSLDRVLSWALQPWAIEPEMLDVIAGILQRRIAEGPRHTGVADSFEVSALRAETKADAEPPATKPSIALIPMHGVIAPRMTALGDISGGTTFEALSQALRAAVTDPAIKAIVFDVDSPGGSVLGAREFARQMLAARAVKPVIAQVHYSASSAAYWASAGATKIVAAPSSHVGAIGVYLMHDDISAALTQKGIARTFISAGEEKLDGNPSMPLSDRAKTRLQAIVDETYGHFLADIAAGRGRTSAEVKDRFGRGTIVSAEDALERGMVDEIATLEDTLFRVAGDSPAPLPLQAATDTPQEPSRATGQDRDAERALERALLELQLS